MSLGASQVALVVKNLPVNAGDMRDVGSIPGSGRSPGGGHGNPPQDSCLENPVNRRAWWAIVHGIPQGWTQLGDTSTFSCPYLMSQNQMCLSLWTQTIQLGQHYSKTLLLGWTFCSGCSGPVPARQTERKGQCKGREVEMDDSISVRWKRHCQQWIHLFLV